MRRTARGGAVGVGRPSDTHVFDGRLLRFPSAGPQCLNSPAHGARHTDFMDWAPLAAALAGLVLAWVAFVALLWLKRPRDVALAELVSVVPDVLRLIRRLLLDQSSPRGVRIALVLLLVWLVSPVDVIPEFLPVIGPLDDVVVAVLILRYVHRHLGTQALRASWGGSDTGFRLLLGILGPG